MAGLLFGAFVGAFGAWLASLGAKRGSRRGGRAARAALALAPAFVACLLWGAFSGHPRRTTLWALKRIRRLSAPVSGWSFSPAMREVEQSLRQRPNEQEAANDTGVDTRPHRCLTAHKALNAQIARTTLAVFEVKVNRQTRASAIAGRITASIGSRLPAKIMPPSSNTANKAETASVTVPSPSVPRKDNEAKPVGTPNQGSVEPSATNAAPSRPIECRNRRWEMFRAPQRWGNLAPLAGGLPGNRGCHSALGELLCYAAYQRTLFDSSFAHHAAVIQAVWALIVRIVSRPNARGGLSVSESKQPISR